MNGIHGEKEKDKKKQNKFTLKELYQSSLMIASLIFIFYIAFINKTLNGLILGGVLFIGYYIVIRGLTFIESTKVKEFDLPPVPMPTDEEIQEKNNECRSDAAINIITSLLETTTKEGVKVDEIKEMLQKAEKLHERKKYVEAKIMAELAKSKYEEI